MLRSFINRVLLEQERSEEQEVKEVKDLFQRWIDEYSTSYLAHRKKVSSNSWVPTQISVKELDNFIFISPSFEENNRDDLSIVTYNKENKSIYCVNTQTLVQTLAFTLPYNLSLTLAFTLTYIKKFTYYMTQEWASKISVDQFRRVMDVTKGNYAQFEALAKKLSDLNQRNANV
jgi:hypothetical protein